MLRKFKVKNFKNFREEFTLDLSRIKNYEFNTDCIYNSTIAKAVIYGANGCGKSNLRLALLEIRNHITDDKIQDHYLEHFLNAGSESNLAEFYYEFMFDTNIVSYKYGKSSARQLEYEIIEVNGKEVISMDWRSNNSVLKVNLDGAQSLNTDISDKSILRANKRISTLKYVLNNAALTKNKINSALSSMFNFIDFMDSSQAVNNTEMYSSSNFCKILSQYDSVENFQNYLNELGVDCTLAIEELNGEDTLFFVFNDNRIQFFDAASTGTISLSHLYMNILVLKVAQEAQKTFIPFLFIDEYDAYYHYKASIIILNMLKDIECQIVLTTHNTSIMSNDLFRPDCYFIMEEMEAKPVYLYTAKELRKAHNIEKMFKSGSFF